MTSLVSKPDYGVPLIENGKATSALQIYLDDIQRQLNTVVGAQVSLTSYTVATLPPVTSPGMIFVSDETGGAVLCFSDGTDWRRSTDRAVVS